MGDDKDQGFVIRDRRGRGEDAPHRPRRRRLPQQSPLPPRLTTTMMPIRIRTQGICRSTFPPL